MTPDKLKNETVVVAGVLTSLVVLLASFGFIDSTQQASLVGGIGTLAALITAVVARGNVFSKKTVETLVLQATEKAVANSVSNKPVPTATSLPEPAAVEAPVDLPGEELPVPPTA